MATLPQLTCPTLGGDAQSGSSSSANGTGCTCHSTLPFVQSSFSMLSEKLMVGSVAQLGLLSWQLLPVVTTTLPLGVIAGELQIPPPATPFVAEKLKAGSSEPSERLTAKRWPIVIGKSGCLAETPT